MIPETEVFAETVDFQEVGINEPVLGGLSPEGPINRIARILGSRTLWLRAQLLLVGAQGLWFRFTGVLTASYTLPKADAGAFYSIGGTASGIVITLPNGSDPNLIFLNGQTITIKNNNPNSVLISRHPSATGDLFDNGATSIVLKQDDTVMLTYDETGTWYVVYKTETKAQVGMVKMFAGASAPQGYFFCNGSAVSRTGYPHLFGIIGVTYGVGDGSTTFNLPDLRGEFVRGLDAGRGVDTGRVLGSAQADMIEAHSHDVETLLDSAAGAASKNPTLGGAAGNVPTSSFGGTETRPRNVAMNFIINHGEI